MQDIRVHICANKKPGPSDDKRSSSEFLSFTQKMCFISQISRM